VLLGASTAHADIISSDIQPGDLFGPGIAIGLVPFVGAFNYAGIGFTPSQNYTFDSTELAISLLSGPNVLNVYLIGSSGGLPSGVLESFDLNGALSSNPSTSLVTIDRSRIRSSMPACSIGLSPRAARKPTRVGSKTFTTIWDRMPAAPA